MFKHFFYDPFPPPPPLPSFLPFFFFFALSQFRGPDYLGAWNRLFQTLIWRPGETVQNLKSRVPDYPGELTALTLEIILTWGLMLLQSAAIVAMILLNELLVVDKITACVRQICLVAVICKVSKRKTLSGGTFCFEKRLLSIFWASSNTVFLRSSVYPVLKNGTPFTYLVHSYASFLKAVNALSLQYEKITKPEPFSWLFLSHLLSTTNEQSGSSLSSMSH